MACRTCDRDKPNLNADGDCYRCSIAGIGFAFVGGGGFTRQTFSAATNHEVRMATERQAAKSGRLIEPRPVRKELI